VAHSLSRSRVIRMYGSIERLADIFESA